jgi:hypothetical protein
MSDIFHYLRSLAHKLHVFSRVNPTAAFRRLFANIYSFIHSFIFPVASSGACEPG